MAWHILLMAKADFSTPGSVRIGIVIVIALLHVGVILGLIRAFAPDFTATVVRNVTSAFTVTVTTPTPTPPPPPPTPSKQDRPQEEEGAAAPPGKKATPKEVSAPKPMIVLPKVTAPQVAATGNDNRSGASVSGDGTGAAGQGAGTGAGGSGSGTGGGGGGTPAEKIRGDINSARDYPRSGAELRLGDSVVIVLTVGTDGRPKACRVARPSKDPQAGPVTCELAMKRFRFRPAKDAQGKPIETTYGWQQRWFLKGQE